MIFKGLSMKQKTHFFSEGESPTLSDSTQIRPHKHLVRKRCA